MLLPFGIDRANVVDTRTKVIQIPPQEVITRDNISIGVDAVVYVRFGRRWTRSCGSSEYLPATLQLAATTLRSIIGRMELDEVLAKRAGDQHEVQEHPRRTDRAVGRRDHGGRDQGHLAARGDERAMARQAEAERERRAKVIMLRGRVAGGREARQAARAHRPDPAALQLRCRRWSEVAAEANLTIVLPVPIEITSGYGAQTAAAAASPAQLQAMMQSAVALAASQQRQLAEPGEPAEAPVEARRAVRTE